MIMVFKIACRNILRNSRRSVTTIAAVAISTIATLLFGAFMGQVILGFQTSTVQRSGHLAVFHAGYFNFGTGNPAAFGISGYRNVMELIKDDPVVGPMTNVVTPAVSLYGIAGNFELDTSKTFIGFGAVPRDRDRMRSWDEYHLMTSSWLERSRDGSGLVDDDINQGVIGRGLARILGLCQRLKLENCPIPPTAVPEAEQPAVKVASADDAGLARDLSERARHDGEVSPSTQNSGTPRIDLLAATAGGAPNVVTLYVRRADYMGFKDVDDSLIAMNLTLAQQLLYGRDEHKVTSIVLQLHRTEDIGAARRQLETILANKGLEVHDFVELTPLYNQVIALFASIFTFIAIIMGVIVLFTVVNTMSMSVMERTNEIGTLRAMGVRRSGIRCQFLAEGLMLGLMGATVGVVLAAVIVSVVNHSGLTWMPPGTAEAVPLQLLLSGAWSLIISAWLGLIFVATIAALVPANRAARMLVIDALRHV